MILDEVLVERYVRGDVLTLPRPRCEHCGSLRGRPRTPVERLAAVARLSEVGTSASAIAELVRVTERQVVRDRRAARKAGLL